MTRLNFGVTHSAPSQALCFCLHPVSLPPTLASHKHFSELQNATALNSVTPCQTQLGTVQFNNWSPLIALQTRLCWVEISFLSYSWDFFSSPAAGDRSSICSHTVKQQQERSIEVVQHNMQQGSTFNLSLTVQTFTVL